MENQEIRNEELDNAGYERSSKPAALFGEPVWSEVKDVENPANFQ